MKVTEKYKPGIPNKYLIVVAGIAWTIAGGILLIRGMLIINQLHLQLLKILISLIVGVLFYFVMFRKISLKHINRITNIKIEKPCIFSFFDLRSYILMSIMITMGIGLRLSGLIPLEYLSLFFVTMSIPLLISASRFYLTSVKILNQNI